MSTLNRFKCLQRGAHIRPQKNQNCAAAENMSGISFLQVQAGSAQRFISAIPPEEYKLRTLASGSWPSVTQTLPDATPRAPEACIKMAGLSAPAPQAQGRGVRFVAEWVWLALIGNAE